MTYSIGDLVTYNSVTGGHIKGKVVALEPHAVTHQMIQVVIRVTTRTSRLYPLGDIIRVWDRSVFLYNRTRSK